MYIFIDEMVNKHTKHISGKIKCTYFVTSKHVCMLMRINFSAYSIYQRSYVST